MYGDIHSLSHCNMYTPRYVPGYVVAIATPVHTAFSPVPALAPPVPPVCGLLEISTIPPPATIYRYNEEPNGYSMLDRCERERARALEKLAKKVA